MVNRKRQNQRNILRKESCINKNVWGLWAREMLPGWDDMICICVYFNISGQIIGTSALAEVTAKWWFSKGIAPKMPKKMLQYMAQEVDVRCLQFAVRPPGIVCWLSFLENDVVCFPSGIMGWVSSDSDVGNTYSFLGAASWRSSPVEANFQSQRCIQQGNSCNNKNHTAWTFQNWVPCMVPFI